MSTEASQTGAVVGAIDDAPIDSVLLLAGRGLFGPVLRRPIDRQPVDD